MQECGARGGLSSASTWGNEVMARTQLFGWLQQAASAAGEAATRNVSTDQVLAEHAERRLSRRDLLKLAGATGLAAGLSTLDTGPAGAADGPRIVVVGAGLAGLTCAYRLKQAGYAAAVYEAADRIGGRCWTRRDAFADGQIAERGGELIDQGHTAIRQLTQELGSCSTTCSPPRSTGPSRATTSTVPPTRSRRRPTISRGSTRRCTATCRKPATPPCTTATPSGATSWISCRSATGSTRTCPGGSARGSGSCWMWP